MDSFEFNKIAGAVLATLLALVALNIATEALFAVPPPAKPGYEIAVTEHPGETGKPSGPTAAEPIEQALAKADPKRGEATAKVCQTCHNLTKGAGPKIGPDLWGVVGRPRASISGFAYSDGMKSKGGDWTVDDLNKFLENPRGFVPGTKMTFAGLPREDQRADVIAYLNTLSDNPKPLPKAAEAKPEKPAGPAAEATPEKPAGPAAEAKPEKPAGPAAEGETAGPSKAEPPAEKAH